MPVSVIGNLTGDGNLVVTDRDFDNRVVDMPMQMLLGNPPKMQRNARASRCPKKIWISVVFELEEALLSVYCDSRRSRTSRSLFILAIAPSAVLVLAIS